MAAHFAMFTHSPGAAISPRRLHVSTGGTERRLSVMLRPECGLLVAKGPGALQVDVMEMSSSWGP